MPTLNLEWPFVHLNLELDAYPWQKQEVFKGVSALGSLSAGWGFHVWRQGDNRVRYSAAGANQLVAGGAIVTNAVFNRDVEAMFQPTISDFDKACRRMARRFSRRMRLAISPCWRLERVRR